MIIYMRFIYTQPDCTHGVNIGLINFVSSIEREFYPYVRVEYVQGRDNKSSFELYDDNYLVREYKAEINEKIKDEIIEIIKEKHNTIDPSGMMLVDVTEDLKDVNDVLPHNLFLGDDDGPFHTDHWEHRSTDTISMDTETCDTMKHHLCKRYHPEDTPLYDECVNDTDCKNQPPAEGHTVCTVNDDVKNKVIEGMSDGKGLSTGAIIGIVVAALFILAIMGMSSYVIHRNIYHDRDNQRYHA